MHLQRKTLVICADHSLWISQLSFLKQDILHKLSVTFTGACIDDLIIKAGSLDRAPHTAPAQADAEELYSASPVGLPHQVLSTIDTQLETIQSTYPALAEVLNRMLIRRHRRINPSQKETEL